MAISSNSLFHYTDKFKTLTDILDKGFLVSYCMESKMAIPMISFCDIPLSQAKYYLDNYGSYALGMTSDWGTRNGLNPVLYLEGNSLLTKNLNEAIDAIREVKFHDDENKDDFRRPSKISRYIINTTRYSKPYRGVLIRNNVELDNYKFYDEREWRYVPDPSPQIELGLSSDEYLEFKKEHPKKPHFMDNGLTFKAKDIKYIVLKTEKEITKLIDFLMNTSHLGSPKQIQLMTTKILLAEQIIDDI